MLRTTVSDRFGALLTKLLPDSLAIKAMNLLGLKVATSPEFLAACIIDMTRSSMQLLAETVAKFPDALKKDAAGMCLGDDVAAEILCAFYAQASVVLREGLPDNESTFFKFYTAKTFDEVCKLFPMANGPLRELAHGASDLYFNDHPTLADLADQMPDYVFPSEVKSVLDMKDWGATFLLKAKTRIMEKVRIGTKRVVFIPLSLVIGTGFIHSVEFFRRLRPVLKEI